RRTTATAAKFPALLSSLQTVARSVQVLPGTVTRVETHVSHRKQTAAYLSTRNVPAHVLLSFLIAIFAFAAPAFAQFKGGGGVLPTSPGEAVFNKACAQCHAGAHPVSRAPNLQTLEQLTPEAIYAAVTTGVMAPAAKNLTDAEKRELAEYLGGRPLDLSHSGSAASMRDRCSTNPPFTDSASAAAWNGWSVDAGNTRFQSASRAGLSAAQVPQLKLKWAFGFPNGSTTYGQPTVVGGRVFVGSDNAYVYSINADTGCVYWSFHAKSGVRTSPVVGAVTGHPAAKFAAYFGDMRGNVYAVNAQTGKLLWTRKITTRDLARISNGPALYDHRLYVPISATEEVFSADPSYPCCTFRGSVVALDADSGRLLWKSYMIPEAPKPIRKNSKGTQLYAPAGAAVWNTPTIDPERHALYVGTGDAYTEPAPKTSDAVVALDLKSGKMLWSYQTEANDAWMVGCVPETTENCPKNLGTDHDIGSSPVLLKLRNGHRILLVTPKSGEVFALDPDARGALLWKLPLINTVAPNNGEIAFGGAADADAFYVPLEDGRFVALDPSSGKVLWDVRLQPLSDLGAKTPNGENRTKAGLRFGQSAAAMLIPGAVFTEGWDGLIRALATADGKVLWQFNTEQNFKTVNGVAAKGGSMGGPGAVVVNGMVFVGSGYANVGGGKPGNVLLAFSVR
ncbi:MAG TPA: PQQ-binding-like beta-propeller repeat protein, partial [Candidatus Dormibacteraeota bacterium]|nr:PQQ-binding-like beta-propeller repeat protein [Candidatus Dormibacteraeota bacterium]